jgi:hypothetical protein
LPVHLAVYNRSTCGEAARPAQLGQENASGKMPRPAPTTRPTTWLASPIMHFKVLRRSVSSIARRGVQLSQLSEPSITASGLVWESAPASLPLTVDRICPAPSLGPAGPHNSEAYRRYPAASERGTMASFILRILDNHQNPVSEIAFEAPNSSRALDIAHEQKAVGQAFSRLSRNFPICFLGCW